MLDIDWKPFFFRAYPTWPIPEQSLTPKKEVGKESEEMIPAPAEAERNIRNAVEGEVVLQNEKFRIHPSFVSCKSKSLTKRTLYKLALTASCNFLFPNFQKKRILQMQMINKDMPH